MIEKPRNIYETQKTKNLKYYTKTLQKVKQLKKSELFDTHPQFIEIKIERYEHNLYDNLVRSKGYILLSTYDNENVIKKIIEYTEKILKNELLKNKRGKIKGD